MNDRNLGFDVPQVRKNKSKVAVQRSIWPVLMMRAFLYCRTYDRIWRQAMDDLVSISREEESSNTDAHKVW